MCGRDLKNEKTTFGGQMWEIESKVKYHCKLINEGFFDKPNFENEMLL